MVHLLPGIWWPVDTMAMATANTLTTNWIFFWLKTAFSADLLCLMFVLCLMKKTMVVSWWVGGEKSERLSKCWLRLWRWRCTWNAQTNTSYALGHHGNLDILYEPSIVVICAELSLLLLLRTRLAEWHLGYLGNRDILGQTDFFVGCTELDLLRARLAEDIAKSAEALFSLVCSMHVHPVWELCIWSEPFIRLYRLH